MKKTLFLIGSISELLLTACNNDDVADLVLQEYDNNWMMDTLHAMMNRMTMTPTNDPEVDFPKMMIIHHQGAINMGTVYMQDGSNDSLK